MSKHKKCKWHWTYWGLKRLSRNVTYSHVSLRGHIFGNFIICKIYRKSPPFKAVFLLDRLRSRCTVKHVSIFGRIRRFTYFLKRPDRLCNPKSLICLVSEAFPAGPEADNSSNLVSKLRMRESIPPVCHISEWLALLPACPHVCLNFA